MFTQDDFKAIATRFYHLGNIVVAGNSLLNVGFYWLAPSMREAMKKALKCA